MATILERCRANSRNVVEEAVVKGGTNALDGSPKQAQISHHPGVARYRSCQGDFGMVGVPVDTPARLGIDFSLQRMGCLEKEFMT